MKHITLVDNGRISYLIHLASLYRFEDCCDGGRAKAATAAARILEIDPNASVTSIECGIPMPGHRITDLEKTRESIEIIWNAIKGHDVIFLLTDSRESRWLPTVLGAVEKKLVITVAIGFDSFVVMRHGTVQNKLSCYFCSDVHAPSDTMSNRTLDQQCTVTRPGISMMAAGTAVELVASILQHPQAADAPAIISPNPTVEVLPIDASMLGALPHQIRGYVGHFNNLQLVGEAFTHCTACAFCYPGCGAIGRS